jgi:hypothetical protein
MVRKAIAFFLLLICAASIGKGWHWAKDGFNIRRTDFPLGQKISAPIDSETRAALDQTFTYLGRGHQCYAFASADGQYVLKLPRYDRYTLPFWLRSCQFPFLRKTREELRADKERRFRFTLESFRIAFEELQEETALLCLHFNETDTLRSRTEIVDRIGRSYEIDLDRTAFVLQRKKPLMMPAFQESLKAGDKEGAKEILEAFLSVIALRAEKGIFNKDPSFLRNFAYDGKGIQIDIGSFYRKKELDPKSAFGPSFLQTTEHVQNWLRGIDPEIASWFEERTREIAIR